jgi:aspartate racemase
MKTIGLLGGVSWVSTHLYYELLNKEVAERLGPGNQPTILMKSFNYKHLHDLQDSGQEKAVWAELARGARDLESIGADVIAICANTMHLHFDGVQAAINIPVLHVADACGTAIAKAGFSKATLLGTKRTMESDFYRARLLDNFQIQTLVPDEAEREVIERVIRQELTQSLFKDESRTAYLQIIDRYAQEGAQCAILGCTEIGLLVNQSNTAHLLFDTTILHAKALVDFAMAP